MKKASLLGISILFLLQGCYAPGISPEFTVNNNSTIESGLPSKTSTTEIHPTSTHALTTSSSTTSPTSPPPSTIPSPTPTFELGDPQMYIGIEIPPLPNGMIEEFGTSRISGEAPPTWVDYHIFEIRAGNTSMLWLGKPILKNNGFPSGKLLITDIVELPIISDQEDLVPFRCRRFEVDRWAIVAIVDMSNGDYSEYDYIDDISRAWIIRQLDSKLIPITSEGVDCTMYPFIKRPILDYYFVEDDNETCP